MTPRPSIDIFEQENSLQKYQERVERLPQQNRVIKNCTDAGFLTTVEVGQYLMTKHPDLMSTYNLQSQWLVVSTLCHEMKNHLTRKVEFEGTPKLTSVLEVTTSCKVNMELKLELNL